MGFLLKTASIFSTLVKSCTGSPDSSQRLVVLICTIFGSGAQHICFREAQHWHRPGDHQMHRSNSHILRVQYGEHADSAAVGHPCACQLVDAQV